MRTIVVGVDGSEPSLRALQFAADLAGDLDDADIVVVFVRHVYLSMPEQTAEDEFAELLDRAEQTARVQVEHELGSRDLRWRMEARSGEPAHALCAIADELDASFLVVGRHGWSRAAELLLGSVSHRLVNRSPCPVLLVTD